MWFIASKYSKDKDQLAQPQQVILSFLHMMIIPPQNMVLVLVKLDFMDPSLHVSDDLVTIMGMHQTSFYWSIQLPLVIALRQARHSTKVSCKCDKLTTDCKNIDHIKSIIQKASKTA